MLPWNRPIERSRLVFHNGFHCPRSNTLLSVLAAGRGGLLRTLVGPIALLAGCLGAFIYYAQNHNIIVAFIISIVAPLILNIFFSLALAVWHKMTKTENPISPASRARGAGLCALWGDINILLIIVLIALVPINAFWIERIRRGHF